MKIQPITVTSFVIFAGAPRLDPITVIMRDIEPGRGELIIAHYGYAWQAYWGATGHDTLREFLLRVSADYVANCMLSARRSFITSRQAEEREDRYLQRIVQAVLDAIRGRS